MEKIGRKVSEKIKTVWQLRQLLFELNEKRPDICIRFRLLGELWIDSFLRILSITEKGVLLGAENSSRITYVPNLNNVMQFELDNNFLEYQAHYHYDVTPG
jgi:hypothetical protein